MAQVRGPADRRHAGAAEEVSEVPHRRVSDPPHRGAARVACSTTPLANATRASTNDGGLGIAGAIGGYPFPIPKTGNEAMWNHLLRYVGVASNFKYDNWNVDSSGNAALATSGKLFVDYPYYDPKNTSRPRRPTSTSAPRSSTTPRRAAPAKR